MRNEEILKTFNEFQLSPEILKAIEIIGYTQASPIQAETLPLLLGEPTDFLGLAATGTGKTAAFSIPMLEKINPELKAVQALVLCPTRELALQVTEQINNLGKVKGIQALSIYGGASYREQFIGLKQGHQIVVGTPGRIIDHLSKKESLKLDHLQVLVLDEADEMISMGFKEDLQSILDLSPREQSNIWLFSATMSREVRKVADEYLRNPKQIQINKSEMLSATVEQIYYPTHEKNKLEVLCKLIDYADHFYGIIFCQTKAMVADVGLFLSQRGYKVDSLHGDKDQNAREKTLKLFREKHINILVCTDVASRGIDVKDVTHVINYSIPRELDSYVHRIGRTARSGKSGLALSLVTPAQKSLIPRIEKLTNSKMKAAQPPTRKEIATKKVQSTLNEFNELSQFKKAQELLPAEWVTTLENVSKEEMAAKFLTLLMSDTFAELQRGGEAAPIHLHFDEERGGGRGGRRSFGGGGRDRYSDRRSDGGSDRGFGRRSDRNSDRFSDRNSDRRSEYGSERRSASGSSRRPFRKSEDRDQRSGGGERDQVLREFQSREEASFEKRDQKRSAGGFGSFRRDRNTEGFKRDRNSGGFNGERSERKRDFSKSSERGPKRLLQKNQPKSWMSPE